MAQKMTFPSDEDLSQGDDTSRNKILSSLKAARGILLAVMSAGSVALASEFMALASKAGIPSFQLLFFLRLSELLGLLPVLVFFRPRLTGENKYQTIMLFVFMIISNACTLLFFISSTYTVPGIATGIIQGSMPLFVACFGHLFLKESPNLVNCCGILINVTGVILVTIGMVQAGPASTQLLVLSIVIPLLASFSYAPDMVIMRYLTDTQGVPIATSLLYQNLPGTVALLGITYAAETPVWTMSLRTGLYVAGLGLSKCLYSFIVFAAVKFEEAYIVTALQMSMVPISMLLDYLFLDMEPDTLQVGGVTLVMLGTALVAAYTWWEHRQEDLHRILIKKLQFHPGGN